MAEQGLTEAVKKEVKPLKLEIEQITRTPSILNSSQVQKIFNTTKAKYRYKRPGKGGGQWDYVRASYMRRTLDSIFGFNWDFDIETTLAEAFEVALKTGSCVVKGTLTGRVKVDGEWVSIRKTQFGRAEVKFKAAKKNAAGGVVPDTKEPLDFGNDMKAAATDCFKKCAASGLGIAADVYDPHEFMEIEVAGSQESSEKEKAKKKQVREAEKALEMARKKKQEEAKKGKEG